jgi:hypothetical protein
MEGEKGVEIQWKGQTCSKYTVCMYRIITMKSLGWAAGACPRNLNWGTATDARKDRQTEDQACIKLGPGRLVCSDGDTPASPPPVRLLYTVTT